MYGKIEPELMKKWALLFLLPFILFSCKKKDKLEEEKAILIGNWEWVYTKKVVNYCDPDLMHTEILTPNTEGTTFQIEFIKKGKVQFFQENKLLDSRRIVFYAFVDPCSYCDSGFVDFAINMDNNSQLHFDGSVSEDSLCVIRDFPYPDNEVLISGQCYLTTSYFARK